MQGTLKSREELAQGLHFMDFEQLKTENQAGGCRHARGNDAAQTYNEKIEERNEDILKLQKKITEFISR